ncbi:hypothetical protein LTR09_010159 [Extremus antarcticus]|uniref:Uncharacterized protein n=1 Tax=Extremus antarcticus TaxID=702011 RepID=A0AAJ0G8W1_9PEZI|nr:hypothetical protein LTR09_010159 [Extremus antarcticus]
MNPNIPNNSHKRSNSGSNFSPPKRVAGGSSSFQGNAQQAQPHVQAGSSEKGKGREQSPMRSAAETRPRSRASTPQEPSLTALEPEGWAEWFERQTAEGFDWTAYIQETMPEALNQQPRARSGTPQVQSDELSGPGVPSPAIEQSWMVLSPGGEHFQSIEPQAPVENQHATVGPTPSQPGIDTGLSQPKAAEWKPPFEALLQWHMHLGRSLIQREIDDDRKTLEARPEFLERRDTLAERCSAKDWGFAWGEKIEVRESFQPLANILERLEVGTKPGAATNQTTSVREFRRNVSGLHGPGPNIRFNHSHRQKPCELLGNLQGKCNCGVSTLVDMTCNVLDGVIVLLETIAPTFAHHGQANPGYPPVQPCVTDISTIIHSQWQENHAIQAPSLVGGLQIDNPGVHLWQHGTDYRNYPYAIKGPVSVGPEWSDWLNYVVISGVKDQASLALILHCLEIRGEDPKEIPKWEGRQTFQLGHWAFYALLSLPRVQDVVWSLVMYKDTYSHKMVKSITIFQPVRTDPSDDDEGYYQTSDWPALLLEIIPWNAKKRDAARELEKLWSVSDDTAIGTPPNIKCAQIAS